MTIQMVNKGIFPEIVHAADFCVVGGGMAGICAALAAARHGARVVLMHDRPVLGGNASSEMRIHICGADRHGQIPGLRETGILEELRLEHLRRNPNASFSVWDLILYEKICFHPHITLLLNCSCLEAEMDGCRIGRVTGWQGTTQTRHVVRASIFADCSGDAVLAPLSGAEFRMGRESRNEFGESLAPEKADARTMGMTCCFHAKRFDTPQPFEPPAWAERFERCEELPFGAEPHRWLKLGYWWVELGGEDDSIRDTERLRDELLRIVLGIWDHIKNRCAHKNDAENWTLDWLQFLPAKRESRRYVGDHLLTQGDIETEGRFADTVAYGGWTMDDHDPAGFRACRDGRPATHWHTAPSPYGIPYRMLYSKNIENLMFAGRCASATHMAMSSTRVMGTGCVMGQAVGTAAAMAVKRGVLPKDAHGFMRELQQALLRDDCYLPGLIQEVSPLTGTAELTASQGDPEPLRDGVHRPVGQALHGWPCAPGDHASYRFAKPERVHGVILTLDSAMDQLIAMSWFGNYKPLTAPPSVMLKDFRLEGLRDGRWTALTNIKGNYQRCVRVVLDGEFEGIRLVPEATWGAAHTTIFRFELV